MFIELPKSKHILFGYDPRGLRCIDVPTSLNISKVSSLNYEISEHDTEKYPKGTGTITLNYHNETNYLVFLPEVINEYHKLLDRIHHRK